MKAFLLIAALVGQVAEAPLEAEVRKALIGTLKDPMGAQLIELRRAGAKGEYICGMVNAKNSYGEFTGFAPFVITPTGPQIVGGDPVVDPHRRTFVSLVCGQKNPP